VGLSIDLPLAQRNQGALAAVEAQRRSETERLEQLERSIMREVALARARCLAHQARLEALDGGALPAAQRLVSLVEEGWSSGRFDVFKLTNALRSLFAARTDHLEALRGYWADRLELERLSGGLP
jgi:cobalt-zinc-cadmium efflux system outer membrane protein